MARAAGITMADCGILREDGRNHFMDRSDKLHLLSLGACAL